MEIAPGAQSAFPTLLSPFSIKGCTFRNRILSSGHDTVMARGGLITDQLIAYQEARARGGAGLIIIQVAGVHPTARYTSTELTADTDECIPGYVAIAEAIHRHGAKVFGQLFHGGREIMDTEDGTLAIAWSASAVPAERFHVMPRSMPVALIEEIVDGFGSAAARLEKAGLDGCEILAGMGYLASQFLNPRTNLREDAWGGTPEKRLRFLAESLRAIRRSVSPGFVVGVRLSIGEVTPDGLTEQEALDALRALDRDGLMDYVHVVSGNSASLAGSDHIVPPSPIPPGYLAPQSSSVREIVSVPVILAGRINQPQEAEKLLAAGAADMCTMTRALIADPEMPAKTAQGRTDDIRACIGCNQACIGHFHAGYPISCVQFPETGRELLFPRTGEPGRARHAAAPAARRVLVVGGGPAGLKAAAVAAERGHRVTLAEAERWVGGQVRLAQLLPGRAEFGGAITNLGAEARRAGVELVTGVRVDRAYVEASGAEVVIVATGATPYRPPLELMGSPLVLDAWEVLRGAEVPEGNVVVADWRCDWVGLGVATLLAGNGRKVTLASSGYHAGQRIQQYVRDQMLAAAKRAHVRLVPMTRPFGADTGVVYLQDVLTEEAVIVEGASALVLATGHVAADGLLNELEAAVAAGAPYRVIGAGDVVTPRTIEEAVLEGLRAGISV